MKIAFVTMQFPTIREFFASNDVSAAKNAGFDVSVYGMRMPSRNHQQLLIERNLEDVPIRHFKWYDVFLVPLIGLRYPFAFARLKLWLFASLWSNPVQLIKTWLLLPVTTAIFHRIRQSKPDVVHLYWSHFPSMVGYLVKKTMPDVKVTMNFIAYDIRMDYRPARKMARLADSVFTITEQDKKMIASWGVDDKKIICARHGLNLDHFALYSGMEKILNRIITAGGLVRKKGMLEVLQAVSVVQKKIPDVSLTVIGDGPERARLEAEADKLGLKHVEFTGYLAHGQLLKAMAESEVFLFLSHEERIPNVVKEAMASGAWVVTTNTEAINELIPDETVGYVVPVGDVDAAAKAVLEILSDKEGKEYIRTNAIEKVRQDFNLETEVKKYHEVWQGNQ